MLNKYAMVIYTPESNIWEVIEKYVNNELIEETFEKITKDVSE